MSVTYKEYECKSVLRIHNFVDNWFWSSASVSPYKACEHACNYCDGRSQKYYASEDFDNIVHVKINTEDILKKELEKLFPKQSRLSDFSSEKVKDKKPKPVIMISSGISDAYQPAEKRYKLTRKILKLFRDYSVPTYVMTKSELILRDLDLLSEINERSWCNVSFSVSTLDDDIAGIFEPRATAPKKRLDALKKITDLGITGGVTYLPIIPFITDSEKHIEDTVRYSKSCGAQYILAGTMTLRDVQARRFYDTLESHFPELVERYRALYVKGYQPQGEYQKNLYRNIHGLCKKYGIMNYIPRYIPDVELSQNFKVSTALFMISYFLDLKGMDRYRSNTLRKVAQAIEDMDYDIKNMYQNEKLDQIPGIGNATEKLIMELLKTGECEFLKSLMWQ